MLLDYLLFSAFVFRLIAVILARPQVIGIIDVGFDVQGNLLEFRKIDIRIFDIFQHGGLSVCFQIDVSDLKKTIKKANFKVYGFKRSVINGFKINSHESAADNDAFIRKHVFDVFISRQLFDEVCDIKPNG